MPPEIWTSGIVSVCASNLTIKWCAGNDNAPIKWWKDEWFKSVGEVLNISASLKIDQTTAYLGAEIQSKALPFMCKVLYG
jgi:hypothetical protein